MKKVIKNTKKRILMVAMFTTVIGYANEVSFKIKNEADKTSIIIDNVKRGNLISIIDNNGIILYKELIKKTGSYVKGFDLTALPDGNYYFELDKDMEIKTIPFIVKVNNVVFKKKEETSIFKPTVRLKGNRLYINKLSLNKAPIKIDLYFHSLNKYDIINSEEILNTQVLERIYKLDEKINGKYKITIKTEGKEFNEYIHI